MGRIYNEAQKRASQKYSANKVQLKIMVTNSEAEKIRTFIKDNDISLKELILSATTEYMNK